MTLPIGIAEKSAMTATRTPRSRAAVASGIVMLAALPAAILTSITLGGGDGVVVHSLFAAGVGLLLRSTIDFRVPRALTLVGGIGMAALAGTFGLQGLADAVPWQPLSSLAYDVLGRWIEKFAVYPVLAWFAALLAYDSQGKSRVVGAFALGAVLAGELYSLWVVLSGGTPDAIFRLAYLLPFVWLLFEGLKRRTE
jgi:hypothetical protein